jgi:hypothetical protein
MLVVAVVSHRMFVPRIRKALLRLRKALGSLRYAQVKERFVQGYRSFCFGRFALRTCFVAKTTSQFRA